MLDKNDLRGKLIFGYEADSEMYFHNRDEFELHLWANIQMEIKNQLVDRLHSQISLTELKLQEEL